MMKEMNQDIDIEMVVDDMFKKVTYVGINFKLGDEVIGVIEGNHDCASIMEARKQSIRNIMRVV